MTTRWRRLNQQLGKSMNQNDDAFGYIFVQYRRSNVVHQVSASVASAASTKELPFAAAVVSTDCSSGT
ncbi:hypothetical protein [Rubinisphaera italica]|uniref:hypothetical protein n=1 Tax=Rubinisphaera italica TaxID=2527969 RepID=UPI0011B732F5|nr:hypothetical protein [Rubinisphaera italica]